MKRFNIINANKTRLFKKELFTASDNGHKFYIYSPTVYKQGAVNVSDRFRTRKRINSFGSLDAGFTVALPKKKESIAKTHRRMKHTDSDGLTSFYWLEKKKRK